MINGLADIAAHDDVVVSDVVFSREHASELITKISDLLVDHYGEIDVHLGQALDPHWLAYISLDEAGALRAYTARDKTDGTLLGYAVFFVRPHMHSKESLTAVADLLYINPTRRGFGPRFIKWCDEQLKFDGVKCVYHSVTKHCDYSAILARHGYEYLEETWGRRL